MSNQLAPPPLSAHTAEELSTSGPRLRHYVRGLMRELRPDPPAGESRLEERIAFSQTVYVTPLDEVMHAPLAETLVATGKNISRLGMGFAHPEPMPYRRVIVTLRHLDGRWLSLLMELRWCRFVRTGLYESGGRFLKALATPAPVAEFVRIQTASRS